MDSPLLNGLDPLLTLSTNPLVDLSGSIHCWKIIDPQEKSSTVDSSSGKCLPSQVEVPGEYIQYKTGVSKRKFHIINQYVRTLAIHYSGTS